MEDLILYKGNTGTLKATIKTGLSVTTGFIGHLVAGKDYDTNLVLDLSTSVWDSSSALFTYSSLDSSIIEGNYPYEFYVTKDSSVFTVGIGTLRAIKTFPK